MTRLLLDSTFLVDADRGGFALEHEIGDEDDVAIAAISVSELLVGVLNAPGKRRQARREFVESVVDLIPIVPFDLPVAVEHARLLAQARRAGRPRGAHDLMIAATALVTDRIIVTADRKAFDDLPGVQVLPHGGG